MKKSLLSIAILVLVGEASLFACGRLESVTAQGDPRPVFNAESKEAIVVVEPFKIQIRKPNHRKAFYAHFSKIDMKLGKFLPYSETPIMKGFRDKGISVNFQDSGRVAVNHELAYRTEAGDYVFTEIKNYFCPGIGIGLCLGHQYCHVDGAPIYRIEPGKINLIPPVDSPPSNVVRAHVAAAFKRIPYVKAEIVRPKIIGYVKFKSTRDPQPAEDEPRWSLCPGNPDVHIATPEEIEKFARVFHEKNAFWYKIEPGKADKSR